MPIYGGITITGGGGGTKELEWINVKDYGAVGNGVANDTTAIRNAIEAARQAASPTKVAVLYFPAGTYKTKPFYLVSNTIYKGDGIDRTIIKRIADPNDTTTYNYPPIVFDTKYQASLTRSFIKPRQAKGSTGEVESNITFEDITIDASGYDWGATPTNVNDPRPQYQNANDTFVADFVSNLTLRNLKMIDSMNWSFRMRESSKIFIDNIIIDGDSQRQAFDYSNLSDSANWGDTQPTTGPYAGKRRWNQDGLNIGACSEVFAQHLKIFSQDDNIVLTINYATTVSNIFISDADLQNIGNGRNILLMYAGRSFESTVNQTMQDIKIDNVICRSASTRNILIMPQNSSSDTAQANTVKTLKNVYLTNIVFPEQPSPNIMANIVFDLATGLSNANLDNVSQSIENLVIECHAVNKVNHPLILITTPVRDEQVLKNCMFNVNCRYDTATASQPALTLRNITNSTLKGVLRRTTSTGPPSLRLASNISKLDIRDFAIVNEDNGIVGSEPAIRIESTTVTNLYVPSPSKLMKTHFLGTNSGVAPPSSIFIEEESLQTAPTVAEQTTSPFTIINTNKFVRTLYISRSGGVTQWEYTQDGGTTYTVQTAALPSKLVLPPNHGIRVTFDTLNVRIFTLFY